MNRTHPNGSSALTGCHVSLPVAESEAVDPARRVVLRGALAAGCSVLLPASLLGCSKDEADTAGTAGTEPPPAPATSAPSAPAEPAKASQASVQYQTEPKNGQACADCLHFIAESNTCKVVEGDISPTGWCALWVQKV